MDRARSSLHSFAFVLASALAAAALVAGCSAARWQEVGKSTPFTGDRIAEGQIANAHVNVVAGQSLCVSSDRLRATANGAGVGVEQVVCAIDRGARLDILQNPERSGWVKAKRANGDTRQCPATFFVPASFLVNCAPEANASAPVPRPASAAPSAQPVGPSAPAAGGAVAGDDEGTYFAVLNVATETLRVYEICRGANCARHRLLLETPMLAGPDLEGRRTRLGEYRITQWHQFYEDNRSRYPSFYRAGYPELPGVGASLEAWLSPSLLPGGSGLQRGNFGWYTATLEPNAEGQWLQGTWGWAEDSAEFLSIAREHRGPPGADIDTHGCTRVDNVTSAYLRRLLPPRTVVLRVYAKEATGATQAAARPRAWRWTLDGMPAAAISGRAPRLSGDYLVNANPTAKPFAAGNKYRVSEANMRGQFNVDAGTFDDYRHPQGLEVGGYGDRAVPDFALSR